MEKENLQNSQQGNGSEEKNQMTNPRNDQQNSTHLQAGLGRERMIDIEDLENNYPTSDNNDLTNENINASNDQ